LFVNEPTANRDEFILSALPKSATLKSEFVLKIETTLNYADAMAATRSASYDAFMAPSQVAASALSHGYTLIGSSASDVNFLLIARKNINSIGALRGRRLYLPQEDSINSYIARGLLTQNGLSYKDFSTVTFGRYPMAGLTAVAMGTYEATMVSKSDWEQSQFKDNPDLKILSQSITIPGGRSLVVKTDMPSNIRQALLTSLKQIGEARGINMGFDSHAELSKYKALQELGTFTPVELPGTTLVDAKTVALLLEQGVPVVDTRVASEYKQNHIAGALSIPYGERSLKDVAFDGRQDEFAGLAKLDKNKPVVFYCNGPECWKSYKASRAAVAAGFVKVYRFRDGLPAWIQAAYKTASD
jgi:rhodanese-related sulfurtransferase